MKKALTILGLCLAAMSSQAQPAVRSSLLDMQVKQRELPAATGAAPRHDAAQVLRRVLPNTEIYGNIFKRTQSQRGIYSIAPSPYSETLLFPCGVFLSYGSALVGDQYYGCELYDNGDEESNAFPIMYQVDVKNWRVVQGLTFLYDYNLIATETCVDRDTETVYGAFFNEDATDLELAIVDYATHQKQVIGQLQNQYVAMGITRAGQIYGVALDSNLYKIDKSTAQETLVGATGVQVLTTSNQYYSQSGEIDQLDDTFYWSAVDGQGRAALYTVDLTTGQATKLADLEERILGLALHGPEAVAEAPAAATGLTALFSEGATTGQVSFTAPATTFGGDALSGQLGYTVRIDSQLLTGTVAAGSQATVSVSGVSEGLHTIVVRTSNDAGLSPKATIEQWIGFDQPQPATDVQLAIDAPTATASVSWTAPTATVHQGYLGPLAYDVYRIVGTDTLLVAHELQATTFSEQLDARLRRNYIYGVVAVNGTQRSRLASSNSEVLGSAFEPPFFEDFLSQAAFDLWTTIDVNGDAGGGYYSLAGGWSWCQHQMWGPGTNARYGHSEQDQDADDWLVSPPIALKGGRSYLVTVPIKCGTSLYEERFEARMGTGAPAKMTTVIIPDTRAYGVDKYVRYQQEVSFPQDGNYRIAIHAMSPAGSSCIMVDSVSVEAVVLAAAPDSVTALTISPDAIGELQARVAFSAPTKDLQGNALAGKIDHIDLLVNHEKATTFEQVAPGAQLSYDVEEWLLNGNNVFEVLAYNEAGQGRKAEQNAYVGVDVPQVLTKLTATEGEGSVLLQWQKVGNVGQQGHVVNPAKVVYKVWDAIAYTVSILTHNFIADVTDGDEYTADFTPEYADQYMAYWAVQPTNVAGEADPLAVGLLVGDDYELPFFESVQQEELTYYWDYVVSHDNIQLGYDSEAADADGGALYMAGTTPGSQVQLTTGKICLATAKEPALTFSVKSTATVELSVVALTPDGEQHVLGTLTPTKDYTAQHFSLKQLAGQRHVRLDFIVAFPRAAEVHIDAVRVADEDETLLDIEAHSRQAGAPTTYYNMLGQPVGKPMRGRIYVNGLGKKIIINK